uniref:DUF834 domain-containing protein n=1 Tax=Oryza glumipatula TaxID=40148 RepID=A0A0D9ZTM9_9ORYZ
MASGKRQEGRGRPMGDGVVATGAGCAATQQPGNKAAHPRGRTACRRRAQGQGNGDGESRWLGLRLKVICLDPYPALIFCTHKTAIALSHRPPLGRHGMAARRRGRRGAATRTAAGGPLVDLSSGEQGSTHDGAAVAARSRPLWPDLAGVAAGGGEGGSNGNREGDGEGRGARRWAVAAGIAMAAWMASAEGAKAAAVVPARQASNGAVLGGDGGGLPQIRASWPDLEGGSNGNREGDGPLLSTPHPIPIIPLSFPFSTAPSPCRRVADSCRRAVASECHAVRRRRRHPCQATVVAAATVVVVAAG